jgi:predicted PurR-regulated permease PerM
MPMKFRLNEKYNTLAAYAMIVIAFGLLYALLLFNLDTVFAVLGWFFTKLKCVVYAIFFAFLIVPSMRFFERFLTKHFLRTRRRRPLVRVLSVILADLVLLAVMALLAFAIFPSLSDTFGELQSVVPPAIDTTREWIETNVKDSEILLPVYEALTGYLVDLIFSSPGSNGIASILANYVQNVANEVSAIFLGLVLASYSLLFRKKIMSILAKILSSVLPNKFNRVAYTGIKRTYFYFMEYASARLVSAIYLSLFSLLFCLIFGIPFRSLIAILVFIFNLFPQFGGILITVVLPLFLAITSRPHALPLFLILLVLHAFHLSVVEPFFLQKRLRPNLGLSISLSLIFGALFGFLGFLFAIPIYTSLHAFVQSIEAKRLMRRGLPVNEEYYLTLKNLPSSKTESDPAPDSPEGDAVEPI